MLSQGLQRREQGPRAEREHRLSSGRSRRIRILALARHRRSRREEGRTHKVDVTRADKDDVLQGESARGQLIGSVSSASSTRARKGARRTKGAPGSGFLWCVRGWRRELAMDGRLRAGGAARARELNQPWDDDEVGADEEGGRGAHRTLERLRWPVLSLKDPPGMSGAVIGMAWRGG